jgi:hypothetical protein
MRLRLAALILAVSFAVGTSAQTGKQEQKLPVLHFDIQTNVKGPDPITQAFLKPITDALYESFEIRPGVSGEGDENFEIRMFVVKKGTVESVNVIVLSKFKNSAVLAYVGSQNALIDKDDADVAGRAVLQHIDIEINEFLNLLNGSKEH